MRRNIINILQKAFCRIEGFLSGKSTKFYVVSRAVMATILGLFLSTCLVQPLSMTTSAMFSSPDKRDFKLPDLFAQIADNRPVRQLDPRIVIVNIGRGSREDIAEALSILSLCGPKAVGIDINFAEPSDDDSFLLETLESLPNPVLPIGVSATRNNSKFSLEETPFFFEELHDLNYGVVNLPSEKKGTVREFAIEFPTTEGKYPSFVAALSKLYDPDIYNKLKNKQSETGITAYHSREYKIFNLEDIEEHAEEFTDKIVMVGALEDAGDMHATPIESHVAGVMLHAAALSTVLDETWIDIVPKYFDYMLAVGLCLAIMLIVYGIRNNFKGIVLRLVQASLAYIAVRVGYELYVDHNLIFDISFTVTIIAFGLFAADIWNSIEAFWKMTSKKITNLAAKYADKPSKDFELT